VSDPSEGREGEGLLPCPFCWGEGARTNPDDHEHRVDCVYCTACNAIGPDRDGVDCVAAWNDRECTRCGGRGEVAHAYGEGSEPCPVCAKITHP
jgi:hypothetical protein